MDELAKRREKKRRFEEAPFGACPECGYGEEYRNIYRAQFFFCDEHRLVWLVGWNLFSSWQHEDEACWLEAWEHLKGYRVVDRAGRYKPGRPLGEQTSLEALMPQWARGEEDHE